MAHGASPQLVRVLISSVRASNPVSQERSSRRIPNSPNDRFSADCFRRLFRIDHSTSSPVGKDSDVRPRLRPRAYVLAGKKGQTRSRKHRPRRPMWGKFHRASESVAV